MNIDYDELPDDPDLAFVYMEANIREHFLNKLSQVDSNTVSVRLMDEYKSRLGTLMDQLGINGASVYSERYMRTTEPFDEFYVLQNDCDNFALKIKIREAQAKKRSSVPLDASMKGKLRNYIQKLRETVDTLDISQSKKDALFSKINALQAEVDRDRTRFQAFGDLFLEACGTVGVGADKLEPLRKWLNPIGDLLAQAKEESVPSLPKPPTKQIEAPRHTEDDGDEVPL